MKLAMMGTLSVAACGYGIWAVVVGDIRVAVVVARLRGLVVRMRWRGTRTWRLQARLWLCLAFVSEWCVPVSHASNSYSITKPESALESNFQERIKYVPLNFLRGIIDSSNFSCSLLMTLLSLPSPITTRWTCPWTRTNRSEGRNCKTGT